MRAEWSDIVGDGTVNDKSRRYRELSFSASAFVYVFIVFNETMRVRDWKYFYSVASDIWWLAHTSPSPATLLKEKERKQPKHRTVFFHLRKWRGGTTDTSSKSIYVEVNKRLCFSHADTNFANRSTELEIFIVNLETQGKALDQLAASRQWKHVKTRDLYNSVEMLQVHRGLLYTDT